MENKTDKIIFWGARGHAKVLRECAFHNGYELIAVFDNDPDLISPFLDVPLYRGEEGFAHWLCHQGINPNEIKCLVAIGGSRGRDRLEIQRRMESKGFIPACVVHPRAFVARGVHVGKGSQILAKSAVCVDANIGESSIINTGAVVDHDTILGEGVHVGPGAHVAGEVVIGRCSMIGAGATVLPKLHIGENVIVGAGSVVTKNIGNHCVVIGNPARMIRKKKSFKNGY